MCAVHCAYAVLIVVQECMMWWGVFIVSGETKGDFLTAAGQLSYISVLLL